MTANISLLENVKPLKQPIIIGLAVSSDGSNSILHPNALTLAIYELSATMAVHSLQHASTTRMPLILSFHLKPLLMNLPSSLAGVILGANLDNQVNSISSGLLARRHWRSSNIMDSISLVQHHTTSWMIADNLRRCRRNPYMPRFDRQQSRHCNADKLRNTKTQTSSPTA